MSHRYSRQLRLRVIPLAIGAVLLTCGSMAVAADMLKNASDRPGLEIIQEKLADLGHAAAKARG